MPFADHIIIDRGGQIPRGFETDPFQHRATETQKTERNIQFDVDEAAEALHVVLGDHGVVVLVTADVYGVANVKGVDAERERIRNEQRT